MTQYDDSYKALVKELSENIEFLLGEIRGAGEKLKELPLSESDQRKKIMATLARDERALREDARTLAMIKIAESLGAITGAMVDDGVVVRP